VTAPANVTSASTTGMVLAAVNYEPIGLRTDISMREGKRLLPDTEHGTSGDAIVVVVAVRDRETEI